MARVHTVSRCLKPLKCGRCGETIKKGEGYRWAWRGFRSHHKIIRCMKSSCAFRQSELTTSKMSQVYAAVEDAEDTINGWNGDDVDDVSQALRDCAEQIREVAQEYNDAAEAMRGAGEEMQEKADELESWAGDIESAADDLPDKPEAESKENEGHDFEPNKEGGESTLCAHCGKPENDKRHAAEDDEPEAGEDDLETWRQQVKEAGLGPLGDCPV